MEEVEELETLCSQYQVQVLQFVLYLSFIIIKKYFFQAVSMDSGTVDTMENVRRAETELVSVKSQVTKIVANWTNTVININKV